MAELADWITGPQAQRLTRWGGGTVLAAGLLFIALRIGQLDLVQLSPHIGWPLFGALGGATLLFAAADAALARGWAGLTDPEDRHDRHNLIAIYGRGVLMKYLPGSVFQYVSRQLGGARAGVRQAHLARASLDEILLHVASSLAVMAGCAVARVSISLGLVGGGAVVLALILSGRPLLRALAWQVSAFSGFAAAAAVAALVLLPGAVDPLHFAAIFLLAWLAGFVVPVAPGGLGIREAAILAMCGTGVPAAGLVVAVIVLRLASVLGDLGFGLFASSRG